MHNDGPALDAIRNGDQEHAQTLDVGVEIRAFVDQFDLLARCHLDIGIVW